MTITVLNQGVEVSVQNEQVIVSAAGMGIQGAKGDAGDRLRKYPFSWGDATPANIYFAIAGTEIIWAAIAITVPFDGDNPTLALGDAGDSSRFLSVDDNLPTEVGIYQTASLYKYSVDTQILLTITPGIGTTQGAGFVLLEI